MIYMLIAVAPVLITTLIGRITHRPFVAAGIVSVLTLACIVGMVVITAQSNASISIALVLLLAWWTTATSFAEAFRLHRSTQVCADLTPATVAKHD